MRHAALPYATCLYLNVNVDHVSNVSFMFLDDFMLFNDFNALYHVFISFMIYIFTLVHIVYIYFLVDKKQLSACVIRLYIFISTLNKIFLSFFFLYRT